MVIDERRRFVRVALRAVVGQAAFFGVFVEGKRDLELDRQLVRDYRVVESANAVVTDAPDIQEDVIGNGPAEHKRVSLDEWRAAKRDPFACRMATETRVAEPFGRHLIKKLRKHLRDLDSTGAVNARQLQELMAEDGRAVGVATHRRCRPGLQEDRVLCPARLLLLG
jgi:hypothetical protein